MKTNPMRHGHSRAVISSNIAELIRHGHDPKRAEAAAYSEARHVWRVRHPGEPFPKHLMLSARKHNPTKSRRVAVKIIRLQHSPKKQRTKKAFRRNPARGFRIGAVIEPKGYPPTEVWVTPNSTLTTIERDAHIFRNKGNAETVAGWFRKKSRNRTFHVDPVH